MDTVFVILSYGGKKQLAKISEDMWIALDRAWGKTNKKKHKDPYMERLKYRIAQSMTIFQDGDIHMHYNKRRHCGKTNIDR